MNYPHVWRAALEMPWAMEPGKLMAVLEVLERRVAGHRLNADEIAARIGPSQQVAEERHGPQAATARSGGHVRGGVAVVPVFGVISQRVSMMSELSGPGGTSTERVAGMFRELSSDKSVGSIVLNIDSPGGGVYGVAELANEIYKARGRKPIVAVANSLAASAAYWLASAADELVVTPGGEVGSIGVYAAHEDISRMLEMAGVTPTIISAGKYKTAGNPYEALTDEARGHIQARVDDYYQMFTQAVATHRNAKLADVVSGYGEGRVVGAQEAVRLHMADRVATLDDTIARLARGSSPSPARSVHSALGTQSRMRRLRINSGDAIAPLALASAGRP